VTLAYDLHPKFLSRKIQVQRYPYVEQVNDSKYIFDAGNSVEHVAVSVDANDCVLDRRNELRKWKLLIF